MSNNDSANNLQELLEWLEISSKSTVKIWCEDPETNKGGIVTKSYLTYRILLKQVGRDVIGIRHRYSEFESLRLLLKDRFNPFGLFVPSLPPKKTVSSLLNSRVDAIFVKERTCGLSLFCETVVNIPFLRHDSDWKAFLQTDKAKSVDVENMGERMIITALQLLDLPYKYTMPQRIFDLKEEITLIEKNAKNMLDKIRSMLSSERSYQCDSYNVSEAFVQWAEGEKLGVKSLAGKLFDNNDSIIVDEEVVYHSLSKTSELLVKKHLALDDLPDYDGVLVVASLEHEISRMESLRELLKVHDEMLSSIESTTHKLNKAESAKVVKTELVAELKLLVDEQQSCLTAYYKGLLHFTLPMCARLRSITMRRVAKYIASTNLTAHSAVQSAALSCLSALRVDYNEAIESTSNALDLLSMKPLPSIGNINVEQSNSALSPLPVTPMTFAGIFELAFKKTALGKDFAIPTAVSSSSSSPVVPFNTTSSSTPVVSSNPLARRGSVLTGASPVPVKVTANRSDESLDNLNEEPDVLPPPPPVTVESNHSPVFVPNDNTKSLFNDLIGDDANKTTSNNPWD
eukprot:gene20183-26201_t